MNFVMCNYMVTTITNRICNQAFWSISYGHPSMSQPTNSGLDIILKKWEACEVSATFTKAFPLKAFSKPWQQENRAQEMSRNLTGWKKWRWEFGIAKVAGIWVSGHQRRGSCRKEVQKVCLKVLFFPKPTSKLCMPKMGV